MLNHRSSRHTLFALLLVLGIGVFHVATIRDGHVWGDDQAMYIAHARNIVEGRPYADTGYIRSPSSITPLAYPPVFPLLLALPYHWYGLELTPMKVVCIGFFCLALFLFYAAARERSGEAAAQGAVAITAACPYFWDFKDAVVSEFPFLAFAYGALLVTLRVELRRCAAARMLGAGVFAGVLSALAYGTRSVGLVLIPAIVLSDWLHAGRLTCFAWATVGTFTASLGVQAALVSVDSDYLNSYLQTVSLHSLLASPLYYLKCLGVLWENGHSAGLQTALYVALAALATVGFWRLARGGFRGCEKPPRRLARLTSQPELIAAREHIERKEGTSALCAPCVPSRQHLSEERVTAPSGSAEGIEHLGVAKPQVQSPASHLRGLLAASVRFLRGCSVLEIFTIGYFLFIVFFPWGGRRYLMPIMPLFVFYAFVGLRMAAGRMPSWGRIAMPVTLGLAICLTFLGRYSTMNWREIPGGTQQPEVSALIEYFKRDVQDDATVVFRKARFLALYSGKTVSDIYLTARHQDVSAFYEANRVSHFVVPEAADDDVEAALRDYIQRRRQDADLVYTNRLFRVFRVARPASTALEARKRLSPTSRPASNDLLRMKHLPKGARTSVRSAPPFPPILRTEVCTPGSPMMSSATSRWLLPAVQQLAPTVVLPFE